MTTGIKRRLIAFVVLSAVGIVYASANYLGLVDRLLGRGYSVTAMLPASGGLYEGSEVTYRGVQIGKVEAMAPKDDWVAVTLDLEDEAQVPTDSAVFVHNGSAVGEQYLDFEPPDDEGPVPRRGLHHRRQQGVAARRRGRPPRRPRPVRALGRQGQPADRRARARRRLLRHRPTARRPPRQQRHARGCRAGEPGRHHRPADRRPHRAADPAGQRRQHPRLRLRPRRGHRRAAAQRRRRPGHPAGRTRGRRRSSRAS